MGRKGTIYLTVAVILLAALACRTPQAPGSPPDTGDAIGTAVAQTLTAGDSPSATEAAPTEAGGSVPTPSVLKVAFVKDGNVWYWEEGTVPAALTALGDVIQTALSDDGSVVAFIRGYDYNNQEIYAVNSDGTGIRPLVSLADFSSMALDPDAISAVPYQLGWVPGTHTLAFNTRLTFEGPGLILPNELRLVDADSGTLSVLIPPGDGGSFTYSDDGSQIALVNGTSISVVNPDGSSRRELLSFPIALTYSEYIYYPPVSWSEDGSFLRAAIPPHEALADPPQPTTLWHLPTDGSPPSSLLSLAAVPFFQQAVAVSPDLSQAAYLTPVSSGPPPIVDLHIAAVDGSSDVIYANGDYRFEGWSEDNQHFLYTESGHNPRIGRVGDSPVDISGVALMVDPSWVDGQRFLYLNRLSASWELWLGDLGAPSLLIASTSGEPISYSFVNQSP